jgi:hypothetical protein
MMIPTDVVILKLHAAKSRTAFLSDFFRELISISGSEFNTYCIAISKGPMYRIQKSKLELQKVT